MTRFISFLMAASNQGKVRLALWLICFVSLVWACALFISREMHASMDGEVAGVMETYTRVRSSAVQTLDIMDQQLTAPPCSAEYAEQQRRIAFLPDGMNELFFFENGKVICTANNGLLPVAVALGEPDIAAADGFTVALWLNRDLGVVGLDGLEGSFAARGNHGMVIPTTPVEATVSKWLQFEVVIRAQNGRWWHASGEPGLYALAISEPNGLFGLRDGNLMTTRCDPVGVHCLAARASISELFVLGSAIIGLALLVSAIVSAWLAAKLYALFSHFWSFEARFLRRFQSQGLVCAYQPLLNLERDVVTGCEALARWRDVDGTMIFPDRFIPLIEKHGFTEVFTRLIVRQAYADLVPLIPLGQRLQVNFNVFPQDLKAERLISIFAPFLEPGSRFDVVIEIVETSEIPLDSAQAEIETLRAAGIGIYIDDFGSGYSSMQTLAGLSVDGVKLDRAFAMAPDDSVMARMLDHAIEMVQASGRIVVVEGVETAARLLELRASGKVDFAQGYHIARPLDIDTFAAFLSEHGARPSARPRLVA